MTKQDVQNAILNEMMPLLTDDQIDVLKGAMIKNMHGYNIVEEETALSTLKDDNYVFLERFRIEKRIGNLAETTVNQYYYATKNFFETVNKNFRDVTYDDVVYYFATLKNKRTGEPLSKRSMNNTRKYIKCFYTWCLENEYVNKNPFLKFKKIKFDLPKKEILTSEEIVMLRDACRTKRELAIIDFLLSTGVRVSECAALDIDNINFNTGKVDIYGHKTRTWRKVYLDAPALKHLADYINDRSNPSEAVFTSTRKQYGRLNNKAIQKITRTVAQRAGVRKKCSVHMFRRTLATRLYRKGMPLKDVSAILGNTVATLEQYYIIMDEEKIETNYKIYAA